MRRPDKQVFDRLGPAGLTRVLDDVMDQPRLIRLANTCGLKYPGMRTQSQERRRIVSDLVKRSGQQATTRRAIYRALQKETKQAQREWAGLSDADRISRVEPGQLNGDLGLHLYLAACSDDANGTVLEPMLSQLEAPAPEDPTIRAPAKATPANATASKQETRLQKRIATLQKKTQHLESQLAKGRDAEKKLKRDVIQRKGELAESRMLAERLRSELDRAQKALQKYEQASSAQGPADPRLETVVQSVRKLASEQRKLSHRLIKLSEESTAASAERKSSESLLDEVRQVGKKVTSLKTKQNQSATEERLDALQRELQSLRKSLNRPPRRTRVKGEARVGVFVDVQNVYYGARRLKGKLDFDALLETAVGKRRLIQATAYVVESKEIDQSVFINLLQQRGIEVRRKTLKVRADGSMKGDWDMELALDILDAAPRLDVVVLVSGDGDFTSLVKRVKRMGPRVEVIGFPRNTAKSLLEAADTYHGLDRKFMIYAKRSKPDKPKPDKPDKSDKSEPASSTPANAKVAGQDKS